MLVILVVNSPFLLSIISDLILADLCAHSEKEKKGKEKKNEKEKYSDVTP